MRQCRTIDGDPVHSKRSATWWSSLHRLIALISVRQACSVGLSIHLPMCERLHIRHWHVHKAAFIIIGMINSRWPKTRPAGRSVGRSEESRLACVKDGRSFTSTTFVYPYANAGETNSHHFVV
ncbi:unnamed protein product [Soboliphyme baturini]|uniref:Secreted protein n=1 Tax=Soboliphyme baturini TaxID=241478 RepID=A0A183IUK9_9BILA|nr:unnamed protein product [Soboliphyme baturini]